MRMLAGDVLNEIILFFESMKRANGLISSQKEVWKFSKKALRV